MYSIKRIEKQIENIRKLANEQAQKVFDDNQERIEKLIKDQLPKGYTISFNMGCCCVYDESGEPVYSKDCDMFTNVLQSLMVTDTLEAQFQTIEIINT